MSASQPPGHSIVVGVDGSEASNLALDWAARQAALHRLPLTIVHAFLSPVTAGYLGSFPDGAAEVWQEAAEEVLRAAVQRAAAAAPEVTIAHRLVPSAPAAELVEQSGAAATIVLGHRGHGGFAGLLLGSVAIQVAAHAHGPVIIVRAADTSESAHATGGAGGSSPYLGKVVVGVDGSEHSAAALEFAFGEASVRGVGLTVVHAWTVPVSSSPGDILPLVYEVDAVNPEEVRALAEVLAGWQEKYPDVRVNRRVVHGRPAEELVAASNGAEMLVVGARGRGGFIGLLMGSVSQAAIHHAGCPVAVIPR